MGVMSRKSSLCLSELFADGAIEFQYMNILDGDELKVGVSKLKKERRASDILTIQREIPPPEDADDVVPQQQEGEDAVAEDEEEGDGLDGGWGWMIVLGAFMVSVQIGGYGRAFGFMFISLQVSNTNALLW